MPPRDASHPLLPCRGRRDGTGANTPCPQSVPGRSRQLSAAPECGRRPHWDCHQLHPEPAWGVWGWSASVLTVGKVKGKSVSTAPQPLAGWTFSPCFATGNVFSRPYLGQCTLTGWDVTLPQCWGALGGAGEVRLGEREDTGLVQHMQLPRLLGTFKASLQLPPQTGWDPAPLSELQMALHFPARG